MCHVRSERCEGREALEHRHRSTSCRASPPVRSRSSVPLSSEYGTHKTVKARFWLWLEPFFRQRSLNHFKLFPSRSAAEGCGVHSGRGHILFQQGHILFDVHIHIYIYTYTYIHVCIRQKWHILFDVRIYIYIYISFLTYVSTYIYTYTYIHAYIHIYTYLHIYILTYMSTHIHACRVSGS